ncbi:MAG: hypothetical protein AB8G86_28505 [Saprospiraceae bacterium]
MSLRIALFLLTIISCFACRKEAQNDCPDNLESGIIIGLDFRKCACCSGYWIEIGNDTLRTFTLPENIEIADTNFVDGLSIPVCLSYEKSMDCQGFEELIDIKTMRLQ